jgi:large subunit ribosomal protein L10
MQAANLTGGQSNIWLANWRKLVDRAEKREFVSTLNQVFTDSGVIVVAHYSGLTVSQLSALRRKMGQAGGSLRVAKNKLVKIALEGTDVAHVAPLFNGPTILAYSQDPMIAPKIAVEFAKTNDKFVILGGAMGQTSLSADSVKALASLPSLDELRAKLLGLIQGPATKIAQVVTAPGAKVARVFGAYASQGKAA